MLKKIENILLITYNYPPKAGVGSLRPFYFSYYLSQFGNNVSVLTPYIKDANFWQSSYFKKKVKESNISVYYSGYFDWYSYLKGKTLKLFSFLKKRNNSLGEKLSANGTKQNKDNLSLNRGIKQKIKDYLYQQINFPDSSVGWVPYGLKLARRIIEKDKIDLILSTSPPGSAHLIAYFLKREFPHLKWIADFRDPWANYHYEDYFQPKGFLLKLLEKYILKKATGVITVSSEWLKQFSYLNGENILCEVVPNGFDENLVKLKKEEINSKKIKLFYGGKVDSQNQKLEDLFLFLKKLYLDRQVELNFLTYGYRKLSFKDIFISNSFPFKIVFQELKPVAYDLYQKLLSQHHILLFFSWKGKNKKGWISGKIYDYLGSGLPILAFVYKENYNLLNLLRKFDNVFLIFDIEKISSEKLDKLKDLFLNPAKYYRNPFQDKERMKLTRRNSVAKLEKFIEQNF